MTQTLSAYEQQYRSAKDVRSRLMGKPPARVKVIATPILPKPVKLSPEPSWKISETNFDRHVTTWRGIINCTASVMRENAILRNKMEIKQDVSLEASEMRRSARDIIDDVLASFPGLTWEDLKSARRTQDVLFPRQLCMYELYTQRKDMSYPRIAALFNRKDHSTSHGAVWKIQRMSKEEREAAYLKSITPPKRNRPMPLRDNAYLSDRLDEIYRDNSSSA